ncbi:MAG: DUF4118 domain-containing protein [Actinobacteria bacterium]|nr:DUF4118 domain-containing protein [Actinomycetota bacterium]
MRLPRALRRSAPLGAVLIGSLTPGSITLLAALPAGVATTSAAVAYVLAVTGAAIAAGIWAGLVASVLSFLALNFFFTPPFHTLSVSKTEDLVALFVFLIVSVITGWLVSRALSQRALAERRETEARLLHDVSSQLLSGTSIADVLRDFARAVVDLFGLARCEITVELAGETVAVDHGRPVPGATAEVIPMVAKGREEGRVQVVPGPLHLLDEDERDVIRTFASQVALALTSMRLASEAENARVDAEASQARAALFSSVTHDLRTPLASITASVTSLLDESPGLGPEDRHELLETIRQEAERLNRLVGNLLDLSRIRAGALSPVKGLVAIDEVIEGVVARLQPRLQGYAIRLVLRDNLPEVWADVTLMDQVLTNLLENAAKFSPEGSRIEVFATRWQNGVQVRIVDQGPGIPPDQRERVFEPFVRGAGQDGSGAGLGLSIAREIVMAHGGRIWIEGAPGGGTAVNLVLPRGG